MQTLSYGYKKPSNPDTGDQFFPAMEQNIQRMNDHNHDGSNSAPLTTVSQQILAAAWLAAPVGGGVNRQLVTIPDPFDYDVCTILFKLSSGEYVYPSVERVSNKTYYIYTNTPALTYTAFYR